MWDKSAYFQFVDDAVSSVGYYIPFLPKTSPLFGLTATISTTALIDPVWPPVSFGQQFFCRDRNTERLQELMIPLTGSGAESDLPPQLFADNIGCWRWTGEERYGIRHA